MPPSAVLFLCLAALLVGINLGFGLAAIWLDAYAPKRTTAPEAEVPHG